MKSPRPPYDQDDQYPPPKKKSSLGKVLLILAAVFFGCGLLVCIIGAIIWGQIKSGMADGFAQTVTAEIDRSKLPAEQKTKIKAQITRVQTGYKNGDISTPQVMEIFQGLAEGPMFPLALIWEAFQKHLPDSHLTDSEVADATLSYQRFARGAVEKSIAMNKVQKVAQMVTNKQQKNSRNRRKQQKVIKEKMTEAEIDLFIETMTKDADDADIPYDDYEVDIAKELKETVDKALKK